MKKFWSFVLLPLVININSFSQEIQWASEVVNQPNLNPESEYLSTTILGKPDAESFGQ